jgi:hypothetical protein
MSSTRELPEVHALAQFFAIRSGCDGVVLLTDNYKADIANYPDSAMIILLQSSKSQLPASEISALPDNVAVLPIKSASSALLKSKVFVCTSDTQKKSLVGNFYERKSVAFLSKNAALSILALRQTPKLNINNLIKKIGLSKGTLVGRLANGELLAIDGKLTDIYAGHYSNLPVLAIVSQFNEVDIIEPVVKHLLNQGVDVHVIDNWSNDGSYEAVVELGRQYPGRISIERFPKDDTHKYEWSKILERVTDIAKAKPQYKWIISNDADEIRWSPWPGISLQRAISFIDHVGFNVVDYTVFNFSPTKDGYERYKDPVDFFEYGDFGHEGWHFMQLKTWRNHPDADIASSSGHLVTIPDPKIFPLKFLLAHYSLRSNAQAAKKVFKDRKPRFKANERKRGWHSHYDKINDDRNFIQNKQGLIHFSRNGQFSENYLIQRVSGIGIKINEISKN